MKTIKVNLHQNTDRSYKIVAIQDVLQNLQAFLPQNESDRYAIISDNNVASLYGRRLTLHLNKHGFKSDLLTFKAGEQSKTFKVAETLLNEMVKLRYTRHDTVIALGGGVTGDIAGFVASIFMRGILLIQIPTSLLAMVDSSIGGKTGINLQLGKNLAGTFHQPEMVIIDPTVLKTLPKNEFHNGFAEIIKYGVIADSGLFRLLEKHKKNELIRNADIMNKIIVRCASIKAKITEKDEREKGLRMILNYGHTTGHAIEALSNYKISHGEAISLGMVIANNIGVNVGTIKANDAMRINKLLKLYDLPTSPAHFFPQKQSHEKLWQIMQKDKKVQKSKINFVIPKGIGSTIIYNMVNKQVFLKSFSVL